MARIYPTQQRCPIARTLELVGDRWTLLVVRDLLYDGPRRYVDLQQSLLGISPRLLADRLKLLEEHGLVDRALYSDHPPRAEYSLTEKGRELEPVLRALVAFGKTHVPRRPRKAPATS